MFLKYSSEINANIRYKGGIVFQGNLTPQNSPLYFIDPFPEFKFSIRDLEFEHLSLLYQIDIGQVRGASRYKDLKPQTSDLKIGNGFGISVNTDLPYMPDTDLHFIIASPSNDVSDVKIYAGFGSLLN